MTPSRLALICAALPIAATGPALAWPGGPFGGDPGWSAGGSDPREGRVSVDRFLAPDGRDALRQTRVAVVPAPAGSEDTGTEDTGPEDTGDPRTNATFEAAVLDRLAKAGYDTLARDPRGGLVAEVRQGREVVEPAERRRSPVSGEMDAGVSNRGSGFGLGINVDLTKPRRALVDTRLELRIRDRASGRALWEGRADIVTREGDSRWTDTAIAGRLAAALFERFPGPSARRAPPG